MGSRITCKCGELVYTNLFSGHNVYRLILDSDYDAFPRPADDDAFSRLLLSGKEVFRCTACKRLIVFWEKGRDGRPTFYLEDPLDEKPPD